MKKSKVPQNKYTLITNLQRVLLNDVFTHCSALLLDGASESEFEGGPRNLIAGFGPDPAWPVFQINVVSLEYELVPADSSQVLMMDDAGKTRPMFRGGIMKLKDGPDLALVVADTEQDLCIEKFVGDEITQVWDSLVGKVAQFWRAPNMPVLKWVNAEMLAALTRKKEQ
jgi:hypothetical protein